MRTCPLAFSFFACTVVSSVAFGATRLVGPGQTYAKPCTAFAAAGQGDIIEIDARGNGSYDGDVCAITVSGLTIRGTNGRAHIDAAGNNAQGKAIWVIQGKQHRRREHRVFRRDRPRPERRWNPRGRHEPHRA